MIKNSKRKIAMTLAALMLIQTVFQGSGLDAYAAPSGLSSDHSVNKVSSGDIASDEDVVSWDNTADGTADDKKEQFLRKFLYFLRSGGAASENETAESKDVSDKAVSENAASENAVSVNTVSVNTVSGNTVSVNTASGNTVSGSTVSKNSASDNAASGNTVSGNTVSGNTVSGNTVSDDTVSADTALSENMAKWTVLIYMSGSSLESEQGRASEAINELKDKVSSDEVNFVLETGGSSKWSDQEISTENIQRYTINGTELSLKEELPSANMGDPASYSDFLNWGIENYPAEKYMTILWGYGDGVIGGAVQDEKYGNSVMSAKEIADAINDTGCQFELAGFDASGMASFELAAAISGSVHYMAASESDEAECGWDYSTLTQTLVNSPDIDGRALGTVICDSYMGKAAACQETDGAAMSVTDLTQIGEVSNAVSVMSLLMDSCISAPDTMAAVSEGIKHAKNYGDGSIYDLSDLAKNLSAVDTAASQQIINAVRAAVPYKVNGSDYTLNNGLTMFYALNRDNSVYDRYADICPSKEYVAYLDAMNYSWRAPKEVYEYTPQVADPVSEQYSVSCEAAADGESAGSVKIANTAAVTDIKCRLYRKETAEDGTYGYYGLGELPVEVSQNAVSENEVSQNAVSENEVSQNAVSENGVSQNAVSGDQASIISPEFDGCITALGGKPCELVSVYADNEEVQYRCAVKIAGEQCDMAVIKHSVSEGEAVYEAAGILNDKYSCGKIEPDDVDAISPGTEVTTVLTVISPDGTESFCDGGTVSWTAEGQGISLIKADRGDYAVRYVITDALGQVHMSELTEIQIRNGKIQP